MIFQDSKSVLNHVSLFTLINGFVEKLFDILKRILVHWINVGEISNDEVKDTTSDGNWCVETSCLIDLRLNDFGNFHSFVNFT